MRAVLLKSLSVLVALCLALPCFLVFAEGEAVAISLSCEGDTSYGSEFIIKITVSQPSVALAGLEFTLAYNSENVTPVVTANTEDGREMDVFMTASPNGWEQFCYHSAEESLYYLRFLTSEDLSSYLDKAGELVLEIPFVVSEAGSFDFTVCNEDILAFAADNSLTLYGGIGSSISVVADNEAQKIGVGFASADTAHENGIYYLDIEVTNLGDTSGLIGLEFDLAYDSAKFAPIITQNGDNQMDEFMVSMPQDSWEQLCSLDEAAGVYTLRFAALHAESNTDAEKLLSGETLVVSLPFKVIGAEGDIASFSVSATSVVGVNLVNGIVNGRGDSHSVSIEKAAAIAFPSELGYQIKNGCLIYATEKTDVSEFLSPLGALFVTRDGKRVPDGYIKTGDILTDGNTFSLTVSVRGDADGNGIVNSIDYVFAKRLFLNKVTVTDYARIYAMSINGDEKTTLIDLIMIKRHILNTYNINLQAE